MMVKPKFKAKMIPNPNWAFFQKTFPKSVSLNTEKSFKNVSMKLVATLDLAMSKMLCQTIKLVIALLLPLSHSVSNTQRLLGCVKGSFPMMMHLICNS